MSAPWWKARLVGLDLETTAANPEDARIVTAALVEVGGGVPTVTADWIIDPGVAIPDEAAAIHGFTTERARAEGDDPAIVIADILRELEARPPAAPIVIFNARYDITVLEREMRRHGLKSPISLAALLVVDPFVIDKHLDRYRRGSRKLDALCEHYGVTLDDAHEAGSDALAACRLAYRIGQRGEIVRRVRNADDGREKARLVREWEACRSDLPALHAAQTRWAKAQAEGLREHFRSQGAAAKGDPDAVRTEWPLCPPLAVKAAA